MGCDVISKGRTPASTTLSFLVPYTLTDVRPQWLHRRHKPVGDTYCSLEFTTPPRSLGSIAVLPTQWLAPMPVLLYHASHSESVPLGPIDGS